MRQDTLLNQSIEVQSAADTLTKILILRDQDNGNLTIVPMPEEAAKTIGRQLMGISVEVAPASALNGLK